MACLSTLRMPVLGFCLLLILACPLVAGQGEWTLTGPYGGSVSRLVMDPASSRTLYAGAANGLYKSTDGGAAWRALYSTEYDPYIRAIAVDPSSSSTVYMGSDRASALRSIDGGETWTAIGEGLGIDGFAPVYALAFDPFCPGILYAGIWAGHGEGTPEVGVYKTDNGGDTWIPAGSGLENMGITSIIFDPFSPGTIYAAGQNVYSSFSLVFKTTNGGEHWIPAGAGLPTLSTVALAIDPVTPTTLYAATRGGGLYKSVNGGAEWNPTGLDRGYFVSVAIDPSNPATLYAAESSDPNQSPPGDGAVHKTTDGGATWARVDSGLDGLTARALVVDPATPSIVYAGTGRGGNYPWHGGVFKTVDGGQGWSASSTGISSISIRSSVASPTEPLIAYVGTTMKGVYRTEDGGATWIASGLSDQMVFNLAIDPTMPSIIWASTLEGVFKTVDGGTTWGPVYSGGYQLDGSLVIAPSDPSVMYASISGWRYEPGGVFRSTDGGATWTAVGLSDYRLAITAVAVHPTEPLTVYAATCYYWDRGGAVLYKSTDGGDTWASANGNLTDLLAYDLVIDPTAPSTLYAATVGAVFKTTNGGAVWGATGLSDYGDHAVRSLIMDPQDPSILYAAVEPDTVLMSEDGARTWRELPTGGFYQHTGPLALLPSDPRTLLAATDRGVWSFTLSGHTRPLDRP